MGIKQPFYSIIVVSLNVENEIGPTIQSVLDQSCTDYEIIVKDGLSQDNTIKNIPDHDGIHIYESKDTGIYDAMNQAILKCQGQYLLFLNCGDALYNKDVLEAMKNGLIENPLDITYGDYYQAEHQMVVVSPSRVTDFYLYRTVLCHQSCFFKRSLFEKTNGFDLDFRIYGDYNFLVNMVVKNRVSIGYQKHIIASYMGGGFSTRKDVQALRLKELKRIRKAYYSKKERFKYGLILSLSMPKLRNKIMGGQNKGIKKVYVKVVNLYNRIKK